MRMVLWNRSLSGEMFLKSGEFLFTVCKNVSFFFFSKARIYCRFHRNVNDCCRLQKLYIYETLSNKQKQIIKNEGTGAIKYVYSHNMNLKLDFIDDNFCTTTFHFNILYYECTVCTSCTYEHKLAFDKIVTNHSVRVDIYECTSEMRYYTFFFCFTWKRIVHSFKLRLCLKIITDVKTYEMDHTVQGCLQ